MKKKISSATSSQQISSKSSERKYKIAMKRFSKKKSRFNAHKVSGMRSQVVILTNYVCIYVFTALSCNPQSQMASNDYYIDAQMLKVPYSNQDRLAFECLRVRTDNSFKFVAKTVKPKSFFFWLFRQHSCRKWRFT